MLRVAISNDFLPALTRLPRTIQKKAIRFIEKFQKEPRSPGLNYEKLANVRDDKVRSLRIDQTYRAIVICPPQGNVYLLVWVDHHDDAYQWVRNRRFEVNPHTGALQVYDVDEWRQDLEPEPQAPQEQCLFGVHSDQSLEELGLPEALIPAVRAIQTEEDLDRLSPHLPGEVADALYMLAAGATIDEAKAEASKFVPETPATTNDFDAAMEHPDTKRRLKVIDSEDQLREMLDAPLDLWRIFLHPSQQKVVAMEAKGPVRVLGGAGTGKTVALMHRAAHLARHRYTEQDDRILVTTYTRNLARDLQVNLEKLCPEAMSQIEVCNLHDWAVRFMRSRGVKFDIVNESEREEYWQNTVEELGTTEFSLSFCRDEWDKVIQADDLTSQAEYFQARRLGRGTRMNRIKRAKFWELAEHYRKQLARDGKVEWPDVIRETRFWLEHHPDSLPYQAVLADESQDFRPADLRLLRTLVPEKENDLFLVGDGHQRIYGYRANLSQCGINVRGRSRRLKLNYRTTQHIQQWAVAQLEGVQVDDLDGGKDSLSGYHSLRTGAEPIFALFDHAQEEQEFLLEQLQTWLHSAKPEAICIATRTNASLKKRYQPMLETAGIESVVIEKDSDAKLGSGVRLATMHRLKGLEYPKILLASVHKGEVPIVPASIKNLDKVAHADHIEQERRLLYVAASRARDELVVCGYGERSEIVVGASDVDCDARILVRH